MQTADWLNLAAKLALRGHGGAEPNPMVGCVVVNPAGELVGWGFHRNIGEAHAERMALGRASERARGSTIYVTLEPCNCKGRTGPCTEAIIAAGVKRVVFAQRDPHPAAEGSEATLRAAGVDVEHMPNAAFACQVAAPFVQRVTTGLPWVIAKWAQSLDGKLATRSGDSKWISSERSRRMVHRERGRVDAILTGIGTVRADDPLLTARHGRKRRTPRRIVIDPRLTIPDESKLLATIHEAPLTLICADDAARDREAHVRQAGADVLRFPTSDNTLQLVDVLRDLAQRFDITTTLVEAGPGLLSHLFAANLVNMAWVFIAPMVIGDDEALPAVRGFAPAHIAQAQRMQLLDARRRDGDVMLLYGNALSATP